MPKLKKLRLSKDLPGVNLYRKDKFAFIFRNIGLTSKRVKTDPAFARTRRKATEFTTAAHLAHLIYRSLLPAPVKWKGNNCYRRLLASLVKNTPLEAFSCNPAAFPQPPFFSTQTLLYPGNKKLHVLTIPPFNPLKDINAPVGATHFTLSLRLVSVNTATGKTATAFSNCPVFYRLLPAPAKERKLVLLAWEGPTTMAIAAIGIAFYYAAENDFLTFNHGHSDNLFLQPVH